MASMWLRWNGPAPGKAKVYFLQSKLFHEGEQFYFLLYGRVASAWALQTVTQGLIIKPNTMRVV